MSSLSAHYPKKVTLTNCDKEPIHVLGQIQPYGFLLVFDKKSHTLSRVSQNVFSFFDISKKSLRDYDVLSIFGQIGGLKLENHFKSINTKPIEIEYKKKSYVTIVHYTQDLIYAEFEPVTDKTVVVSQYDLSEIFSELSNATSVEDMCTKTAHLIRKQFEYDRVMLYKFDEEWNGEVIAESCAVHKNSWLGLHYPATDIPQQARALFLKQGVRIIKDVDAVSSSVYPPIDEKGNALDLSLCELRAVSPIHIEYLKNMKVGATLTAAIICNGMLWGLIACHHDSSKFINYYQRLTVKFLTQVFATQLTLRSSNEVLQRINNTASQRSLLVKQMSDHWDVHRGLTTYPCTFLDVTDADGGAIYLNKNLTVIGNTPKKESILKIIHWIHKSHNENVFKTNKLEEIFTSDENLSGEAAGVLCIFLKENATDCIIWFKPEIIKTIKWGGKPTKIIDDVNHRISPRKSFDLWKEIQKGVSLPWKDYEIASATSLVDSITKVIISKYDEVKKLNEELQLAYKDLETFSYSVSHDLRSPLRGISGFAQIIKEDYFDTLDDYGKTSIQRIIDASNKMNKLIDDIISFSSLGKSHVSLGNFSMQEVLSEVFDFLQVNLLYKHTKLIVQDDIGDVYGDRAMIFQVLVNLLDNALKYSHTKDQPIVKIGKIIDGSSVTYYVKDNGIGFKETHSNRIFEMFSRVVDDRQFKGSGIGLAIVKRIIERHKGKIWTESVEGEGATFFFQLQKPEI